VQQALLKAGISADRIRLISYGKERPFCTTAENESCWQQNRRAHFVLARQ
jgi:peptidoglycan-associated lipoprotein